MLAYRLTPHAQARMAQRHINPWHVLRAVSKRGAARLDGRAIHFDQRSRVTVITDPHDAVIVTVYRAGRRTQEQ
jgi:hypothetical protein